MLQLSKIYYDRQVLSLRTGSPIGRALSPLINPNNLKIEGWYAQARKEKETYIVLASEVRDIIKKGIVVDDHTALTASDDLVRLRDVIDLGFELIGKQVITDTKRKIGKVSDYAVDSDSLFIKKLYVQQSLVRTFSLDQRIIDRSQIVEITNDAVVVRDSTQKVRPAARATIPA